MLDPRGLLRVASSLLFSLLNVIETSFLSDANTENMYSLGSGKYNPHPILNDNNNAKLTTHTIQHVRRVDQRTHIFS